MQTYLRQSGATQGASPVKEAPEELQQVRAVIRLAVSGSLRICGRRQTHDLRDNLH